MKLFTETALHGLTPLVALCVTTGLLCLGGRNEEPARGVLPSLDATSVSVGVKQPRYRFTQADIPAVVASMEHAGIGVFICWIDPVTGAIDLVVDPEEKPHLDMKPGSCPNPVNVDHGAAAMFANVPGGILGNGFDVTQIDIASLRLSPVLLLPALGGQEISPIHTSFEDTGTFFEGSGCECAALGPDGALDLVVHFDRGEMIEVFDLQSVANGTFVPLKATGMLIDGRAIFGTRDCIRVINH